METTVLKKKTLAGIKIRTCNSDGSAAKDIPALWDKFMKEDISRQIPDKVSDTIYAAYTAYEGDHNMPYTTFIGCEVNSSQSLPETLSTLNLEEGNYQKVSTKGNLHDGIVLNKWMEIWQSEIPRTYKTDLEVYDERSSDPTNAVVDIYLSI